MSMGERSGFGNHAFANFNDSIFDACAGPVLDTTTVNYLHATIDRSETINRVWFQPVPGLWQPWIPLEPELENTYNTKKAPKS